MKNCCVNIFAPRIFNSSNIEFAFTKSKVFEFPADLVPFIEEILDGELYYCYYYFFIIIIIIIIIIFAVCVNKDIIKALTKSEGS